MWAKPRSLYSVLYDVAIEANNIFSVRQDAEHVGEIMYNEKDVELLAKKTLEKITENVKRDIADKFYNEMSDYLYEHYLNIDDRVKDDLINQISDNFIQNPREYKYKKLRDKIFVDNKEMLISLLTDEAIYNCVEAVILNYSHKSFAFSWQWHDAIAKIIIKNVDSFLEIERIQDMFARELCAKDNMIESLKRRLSEIEDCVCAE